MATSRAISRNCVASSSGHRQITAVRRFSLVPPRQPEPLPFFTPPFLVPLAGRQGVSIPGRSGGKGNGKQPQRSPEEEVDDREWEMRVARAMLHLRDSSSRLFHPEQGISAMFPPHIFSQSIVLKLNAPLPLTISSLTAYAMAFAIARNGMQAFHSDMRTSLERLTFSPTAGQQSGALQLSPLLNQKPVPAHRQKQVRLQLAVSGTPRLPAQTEATWRTSSLYTFSPYSGLIVSHEVEKVRPLPGEGVAEWLKTRLLGWTGKHEVEEGAIPCPRAIPVPPESELLRIAHDKRRKSGDQGKVW